LHFEIRFRHPEEKLNKHVLHLPIRRNKLYALMVENQIISKRDGDVEQRVLRALDMMYAIHIWASATASIAPVSKDIVIKNMNKIIEIVEEVDNLLGVIYKENREIDDA